VTHTEFDCRSSPAQCSVSTNAHYSLAFTLCAAQYRENADVTHTEFDCRSSPAQCSVSTNAHYSLAFTLCAAQYRENAGVTHTEFDCRSSPAQVLCIYQRTLRTRLYTVQPSSVIKLA